MLRAQISISMLLSQHVQLLRQTSSSEPLMILGLFACEPLCAFQRLHLPEQVPEFVTLEFEGFLALLLCQGRCIRWIFPEIRACDFLRALWGVQVLRP